MTFDDRELYYASGIPAGAGYDVQGDVFWPSANGFNSQVGVAARVNTSTKDHYRTVVNMLGAGFNQVEMLKRVSSVETSLGSAFISDWTASTSRTLLFTVRDATKTLVWNGVTQVTSTDNAITAAGRAGVYGRTVSAGGSDSTTVQLDNFSATDAASTVSLSRSIADTITIGDAVVRSSLGHGRAPGDAITIGDAVTRGAVAEARALADGVGIDDAVGHSAVSQGRSLADAIVLADTVEWSSLASLTRGVGDAITLSDSLAGVVSAARAIGETITIGDGVARSTVSFSRGLADTIVIADSVSRQVSTTVPVRSVTQYASRVSPRNPHTSQVTS